MKTQTVVITMNDELYNRIVKKYGREVEGTTPAEAISNCVWHGIDTLMFVGETDELFVDNIETIKMDKFSKNI